jgi:ribosomal protein L11 methyltransferase
VEAYYDADLAPDVDSLGAAIADVIGGIAPPISVAAVAEENWVAISQAALPPVQAGRYIVHGSHDRARAGGRLGSIEIDAGEAFGTAHHASTLGCLLAIDRIMRRRGWRNVLDLGCGSGVLAIAVARASPFAQIMASDIDAQAVGVARGNIVRNGVGGRIRTVTAIGLAHPALRRAAPFDLVIANILARPLIMLANHLRLAIQPHGVAILSGILAREADAVLAAYRAAGFIILAKTEIAGWTTLTLARI